MSADYLTATAVRLLGIAPMIRPRVSSRYEPRSIVAQPDPVEVSTSDDGAASANHRASASTPSPRNGSQPSATGGDQNRRGWMPSYPETETYRGAAPENGGETSTTERGTALAEDERGRDTRARPPVAARARGREPFPERSVATAALTTTSSAAGSDDPRQGSGEAAREVATRHQPDATAAATNGRARSSAPSPPTPGRTPGHASRGVPGSDPTIQDREGSPIRLVDPERELHGSALTPASAHEETPPPRHRAAPAAVSTRAEHLASEHTPLEVASRAIPVIATAVAAPQEPTRRFAPGVMAPDRDAPPREQPIHVTIGRIEIRATPPVVPALRPRRQPTAMGLDAYFRRKAERGRP